MAKTGSYIKLDRGLKKNSLWLEKPFSKGQAWVDLLLLAQGIDKEHRYRGQIQNMKSGTVYTSIRYLEKRWGWSRNKVYRFFDLLEKEHMISVKGWEGRNIATEPVNGTRNETKNGTRNGTTNGTIVTIENWAFYQYVETNNETNNETNDGTRNGTGGRNRGTEHTIECTIKRTYNTENKKESKKKKRPFPSPLDGGGDVAKATMLKPVDEGTVDDIPDEYRDFCKTYEEYWRFRNR